MQGLLMLLMMFAMTYFLMIRPQTKRQKAHREMLDKLAADDLVITRGGTIGTITAVLGQVLVLEINDRVTIRVPRAYIDGKWNGMVPEVARHAA